MEVKNDSIRPIMPPRPTAINPSNPYLAENYCKQLIDMINCFNFDLDEKSEVGLELCNFSENITMNIKKINYFNPSLIIFDGIDISSNSSVRIIQHTSQINVLLKVLPRVNTDEPKQPIGFRMEECIE
jgi:hypothetical protein